MKKRVVSLVLAFVMLLVGLGINSGEVSAATGPNYVVTFELWGGATFVGGPKFGIDPRDSYTISVPRNEKIPAEKFQMLETLELLLEQYLLNGLRMRVKMKEILSVRKLLPDFA